MVSENEKRIDSMGLPPSGHLACSVVQILFLTH
jgi:hypothetical protein